MNCDCCKINKVQQMVALNTLGMFSSVCSVQTIACVSYWFEYLWFLRFKMAISIISCINVGIYFPVVGTYFDQTMYHLCNVMLNSCGTCNLCDHLETAI